MAKNRIFKRYTISYCRNVHGIELFVLPVEVNRAHINLAVISGDQQSAIATYRRPLDRDKRLLARSFLLEYCQAYYDLTQLAFTTGPYYRPLLAAGTVHFSFSYADQYAAIALSPSGPLGIDMAYQDSLSLNGDLPSLVMSPGELATFQSLNTRSAKNDFFYRVWTAKESLFKAWGIGLMLDDITSVDVMTRPDRCFFYQGSAYRYQPISSLSGYAMGLSFAVG